MLAESDTLSDWNDARSLATDLITAVTTEATTLDAVAADWPHLSLPAHDTIRTAVEVAEISAQNRDDTDYNTAVTNTVANWVLAQDLSVDPRAAPDPEAYYFDNWNRTQQVAAALLEAVTDDKFDVADAWPTDDTPPETTLETVITSTIDDHTDTHDQRVALANWLRDYHAGEVDLGGVEGITPPEDVVVDLETWAQAVEVGDTLVARFKEHESDVRYTDLRQQWPEFAFPHRDEVLMEIMNLTGDTRKELVEQAAEYVLSWDEDAKRATPSRVQSPYRGRNRSA